MAKGRAGTLLPALCSPNSGLVPSGFLALCAAIAVKIQDESEKLVEVK